MVTVKCYNLHMKGELSLFITTASGLLSLATGIFVLFRGRRQLVNILFFSMTVFLALWSLGDGLTIAASSLEAKIFWTRFQGLGELPLVPSYLLLALFFPRTRDCVREWKRAVPVILAIYGPFLLGLAFLYTTGLVYPRYLPGDNIHGLVVARTPFFWFLTVLGFSLVLLGSLLYYSESRESDSLHRRRGLMFLALAPLPMLAANLAQNLEWSGNVTTPQASILFVGLLGYGIMRHGLFLDFRSATRRALAHALALTINYFIYLLLFAILRYGLKMEFSWSGIILFLVCAAPLLIAYPAEVGWANGLLSRRLYRREDRMGTILEGLSRSIRTVRDLYTLAADVTGVVRDSLDLASCALMVREDGGGGYRVIGFASHPGHPAHQHRGVVESGMFMRAWKGSYTFDTPDGRFSSYWQVGKCLERGGCRLEYLGLGVLRIHEGGGVVRESLWREKPEGEAISLPLEVGGERVGLLWLGGKMDGSPFSLEELDHLVALCAQVAVSLLNARLVQEIVDRNRRLRELAQRVSSAQEEERIRISRELHDGLAPFFLDILYGLDVLEREAGNADGLSDGVEDIRARARQGLQELRRLISDLRPSSLEVLGLRDSLASYLERFGVENGLEVRFECRGSLQGLDALSEMTLFRVAQEALSNVARHARARMVRLSLEEGDGQVHLEVEDDGTGFVLDDFIRRGDIVPCLGLRSMEERAELAGGRLSVDTGPGRGTRISLRVPKAAGRPA
ncbi:histidine kinase N-terminal 7TM domain-containing protein [Candidatus Solincola sp.]